MAQGESRNGFTLIELSIVLVIIGLIVGGILVGQDLIKAAEVRAQISQIEKYNQAVNTFRGRFGALPGDMPVSTANQFGFSLGGLNCSDGIQGRRDGNGLLDGFPALPLTQGIGETALFWQDVSSSAAGALIDGSFPNGGASVQCNAGITITLTSGTTFIGDYLPLAKIGHGNFVYVYEASGYNWYGLSEISQITVSQVFSSAALSVIQAFNIDKKIDDGLPTTGSVQATYLNASNAVVQNAPNAATDSTTTCYDTTSNVYSIGSAANYGAGGNCALSFRFQ